MYACDFDIGGVDKGYYNTYPHFASGGNTNNWFDYRSTIGDINSMTAKTEIGLNISMDGNLWDGNWLPQWYFYTVYAEVAGDYLFDIWTANANNIRIDDVDVYRQIRIDVNGVEGDIITFVRINWSWTVWTWYIERQFDLLEDSTDPPQHVYTFEKGLNTVKFNLLEGGSMNVMGYRFTYSPD